MSLATRGLHKILAATDFSPSGDGAVRRGAWAAQTFQGRLVVAHVIADIRKAVSQTSYRSRIEFLEGQDEHFQRELRRTSDAKLKAAILAIGSPSLKITYETLLGDPPVEITHAVQQEGYDLVVVGAGQHAALTRLILGSTAKQLLRKCPAAVWVVKDEVPRPVTSILVAVDFSDVSRRAADEALWIAERAGATVHIMHGVECRDVPEELLAVKPSQSDAATFRDVIEADARRRFDDFVDECVDSKATIERHLCWGESWRQIVDLANRLEVSLVVMGTVGRTGLQGALLGNTAENVLFHCDCDVLAVKPADFMSVIPPPTWQLHPGPPSPPAKSATSPKDG